MSTPHVKLQVAVEPGETRTLHAEFASGAYRLRTVEPGGESDIEFGGGDFPAIAVGPEAVEAGAAADGGAVRLVNGDTRRPIVVIEWRVWVRDAMTAYRATRFQAFGRLEGDM